MPAVDIRHSDGSYTMQAVQAMERAEPERSDLDMQALEEIFKQKVPKVGEILTGTVTNIEEFGAFVELHKSGWSGLCHISEICDEFVDNVEDYLEPGQNVEVIVIPGKNDRMDRVSLSIKQLEAQRAKEAGVSPNNFFARFPPVNAQDTPTVANGAEEPARPDYEPSMGQSMAFTRGPMVRSSTASSIARMEQRLNAIEAVLIQLGHGEALFQALNETKEGTTSRSLDAPPLEVLLSGVPAPGEIGGSEEDTKGGRNASREKRVINAVLEDIFDDGPDWKPDG